MCFQRLCVELVGFQTDGRGWGRPAACTGDPAAHADDRPIPGRGAPFERAVRLELFGEIQDFFGLDDFRSSRFIEVCGSRQVGFDVFPARVGAAIEQRLFVDVGDDGLAGWEGQHRHILVKRTGKRVELVRALRRHGNLDRVVLRAFEFDRTEHQVLHRLLRLDPGSPTATPTRTDAEGDVDAEAFGVSNGLHEKLLPLRAHERHWAAGWLTDVHFKKHQIAKTCRLHRFQVGGHFLAIEIAVKKIPVNPGPRRIRRVEEILFHFARSQHRAAKHVWGKRHDDFVK